MGKYEERHSDESSLPFGLGKKIRVTDIVDNETGERAEGFGWTRDEANRNAFERLKKADKDDRYYHQGSKQVLPPESSSNADLTRRVDDEEGDSEDYSSNLDWGQSDKDDRSYSTRDSPDNAGCGTVLSIIGWSFLGLFCLGIGNAIYNRKPPQLPLTQPARINSTESLEDKVKGEIKQNLGNWVRTNYKNWSGPASLYNVQDYTILRDKVWAIGNASDDAVFSGRPYLFYSSDNQKTWDIQIKGRGFFNNPFRVKFLDENDGFVATENSILHTADGGKNWYVLLKENNPSRIVEDLKISSCSRDVPYIQIHLRKWDQKDVYNSYDRGKTWISAF